MRLSPGPADAPGAILVRTPNWLGDLMVATAFLDALLARFPDARVDLIVRRGFEALPLPRRGAVHPFDKRQQSAGAFGARFRGQGFTHLFVLPPSFSAAWMAWRTGIPHRIGHAGQGRRWLLRPALAHRHRPRSVHLLREYLELLAPWGEPDPEAFRPRLAADDAGIAAHLPEPLAGLNGYVALAPGAEYGPAKQWPVAHYRETARALAAAGRPVVVLGTGKERPLGEDITAGLPGALNLCGATDLSGLVAALARAALLISNDSGAMHVAAALGVPQVAVFGSTNPHWTAPLNPRAAVITRNEPCAPCYGRTCRYGHYRCLTEIHPPQVLERAEALLAGP